MEEKVVVSLTQKRKKSSKKSAEAPPPEKEPVSNAFTEEMRIHEMAQAWGLDDEDEDDAEQQVNPEEEEVFNGAGLGASIAKPTTVAKQGSLEERLERARVRAQKKRENRSIELAEWAPQDEDEEEEIVSKSSSKKTTTLKRVKRAFDL